MHFQITAKILGILLVVFSVTMVPPILVAVVFGEPPLVFLRAFGITFTFGTTLWVLFSRSRADMRTKEGFLITVFFYIALGSFGAVPFIDDKGLGLSIPDGLFESFSGLTTTGATVIQGLDQMPKSILYYRQQLQWLGGDGNYRISSRNFTHARNWRNATLSNRDAWTRERLETYSSDKRNCSGSLVHISRSYGSMCDIIFRRRHDGV